MHRAAPTGYRLVGSSFLHTTTEYVGHTSTFQPYSIQQAMESLAESSARMAFDGRRDSVVVGTQSRPFGALRFQSFFFQGVRVVDRRSHSQSAISKLIQFPIPSCVHLRGFASKPKCGVEPGTGSRLPLYDVLAP